MAESAVDVPALRLRFEQAGMPGIVRLVDFLDSEHAEGMLEFGSSSMGPSGNGKIYFGRPKANPRVTPLEDLEISTRDIAKFSSEDRAKIDSMLGALGDSMRRVQEHPELLTRVDSDADF